MAPQAVYLFLRDMVFMDELNIIVLFCSIHMTEITFVFGCDSITFCYLRVALTAFVACFQCIIVREDLSHNHNRLFLGCMTRRAPGHCLVMRNPFEVTEETYIHRDTYM